MNIFITIAMNLLLHINNINLSQIYFLDKKTNIIMDGVFTKMVYSNNCMSMNGLYIDFPIKNIMTNRVHSKNILQLDTVTNRDFFQKMIDIERQLLNYYIQYFSPLQSEFQTSEKRNHIQNKNIVYTLKNQFQNGSIKYYKEYDCYSKPGSGSLYIKISGIWENQNDIGITFKIIEYQKQI
jgi:hypothetical protein